MSKPHIPKPPYPAQFRQQMVELVQTKTSAADDRSLNWDTVKEVVAGGDCQASCRLRG